MNAPVAAPAGNTGIKIVVFGRLSYPDIYRARQGLKKDDGTPGALRYGCHIIVDPSSPDTDKARTAFMAVGAAKWGANWPAVMGAMEASKKCVRNGNTNLAKDGTVRGGYQGMLYIVARNKHAPLVLADKFSNGKAVHVREDGQTYQDGKPCPVQWKVTAPYGGCYVNAQIEIYAMEGSGANAQIGRSINASLLAIQFAKDGEAFGGSRADESDFSEVGGAPVQGNDPFAADPFESVGGVSPAGQADPFATAARPARPF